MASAQRRLSNTAADLGLNWFQVLSLMQQQPLTTKTPTEPKPEPKPLDPRDFGLRTRGMVTGNTGPNSNTIIPPQQWDYADFLRNSGEMERYNGNPYMAWNQYNSNMNNYQQAQLDAMQKQQPAPGMGAGQPNVGRVGGMGGGQGLGAQRRQDNGVRRAPRSLTGGLGQK